MRVQALRSAASELKDGHPYKADCLAADVDIDTLPGTKIPCITTTPCSR